MRRTCRGHGISPTSHRLRPASAAGTMGGWKRAASQPPTTRVRSLPPRKSCRAMTRDNLLRSGVATASRPSKMPRGSRGAHADPSPSQRCARSCGGSALDASRIRQAVCERAGPVWRQDRAASSRGTRYFLLAKLAVYRLEPDCSHQVRNIFVGLPDLPQFGSTCSFTLSNCVHQKDRLSHAWSTTTLLISAGRHVVMQMDYIRGARPVLLDEL